MAERLDARVGDHDVNMFEVRRGRIEELDDVGRLGHICSDSDGFAAECLDGLDDLGEGDFC